jgi:hypothetical protein
LKSVYGDNSQTQIAWFDYKVKDPSRGDACTLIKIREKKTRGKTKQFQSLSFCYIVVLFSAVLDAFCDHDGNWNFSNTHWVGKCTKLTQEEYQRIVDELLGSGTQEKV